MHWSGAFALAVSSALVLSGCGGGGGPSPKPTPAPTPPPSTPAPTPAPPTPPPLPHNKFCDSGNSKLSQRAAPAPGSPIGWNPEGPTYGGSNWCAIQGPAKSWNLNQFCGAADSSSSRALLSPRGNANVKVLTYNLYWWNLFKNQGGLNGAAGKNIAAYAKDEPFDLMGFQECEDVTWPLRDAKNAGMTDEFTTILGRHATAIAYRTNAFTHLGDGQEDVAEDMPGKFHYGRRIAQWVRLTHKATGKPVFFVNHHGPTSPNTGGLCGNKATAYHLLKVIATNAKVGDAVILVGDFNAPMMMPTGPNASQVKDCVSGGCDWCEEAGTLACHFPHVFANPCIADQWGIDNFYSTCTKVVKSTAMPKAGSDHMALNTVFELTNAATAAPEMVTV